MTKSNKGNSYNLINHVENINRDIERMEQDLIENEENINKYDIRTLLGSKYNSYLSFEYSNYLNQDIIHNYYTNLQDTSLYNYYITDDSAFYGKVILDIILKITIILAVIALIYYGLKVLDGQLNIFGSLFSNNMDDIMDNIKDMYGTMEILKLEEEYDSQKLYGDYLIKPFIKEIEDMITNYGAYINKFKKPHLRKLSSLIFCITSLILFLLIKV